MLPRTLMVLACAAGLTAIPQPANPQGTGLQTVKWLAGCWELRSATRVVFEMWMPPDGDLMLGASRTTVNGQVREYEQMRLTWKDNHLLYTALPSSQTEATFTSSEVSDSGFVVDNPTHDFPQRIYYRRRGTDSLIARVEGPSPSGIRGFDFAYRRIACTAP